MRSGRRFYLGPYGSVEAEENRLRVWNEYQAQRGLDPEELDESPVTVAILLNRFLEDARKTYLKGGRSTGSYERFVVTAEPLFDLYADTPVSEFGPLALKAVRSHIIKTGYRREYKDGRLGPQMFYSREKVNHKINRNRSR